MWIKKIMHARNILYWYLDLDGYDRKEIEYFIVMKKWYFILNDFLKCKNLWIYLVISDSKRV